MAKLNLDEFKKKLEAEKQTLVTELSRYGTFSSETGEWEAVPNQDDLSEPDENDAADRFEDFEERTAMVATLETRYKEITDALAKMEKGKYGICEIGGEEIELERLEANPGARTCMAHINQ